MSYFGLLLFMSVTILISSFLLYIYFHYICIFLFAKYHSDGKPQASPVMIGDRQVSVEQKKTNNRGDETL